MSTYKIKHGSRTHDLHVTRLFYQRRQRMHIDVTKSNGRSLKNAKLDNVVAVSSLMLLVTARIGSPSWASQHIKSKIFFVYRRTIIWDRMSRLICEHFCFGFEGTHIGGFSAQRTVVPADVRGFHSSPQTVPTRR